MRTLRAFSAGLALCLLAACAGPEARIKKNPAVFAALPPAQQELVRDGRVREGMDKDAVWLAWGRPDEIRRGSREGRPRETWLYYASYQEAVPGWSYHPVRCQRGWFAEPFYEPAYIQRAYVYRFAGFETGRLREWEDAWLR